LQAGSEKYGVFEFFGGVKYPEFSGFEESTAVLAFQGLFSGFSNLCMLPAFRADYYCITSILSLFSKLQSKSPSVSSLSFLEISHHP